jgi:hypothetical protein
MKYYLPMAIAAKAIFGAVNAFGVFFVGNAMQEIAFISTSTGSSGEMQTK